MVSAAVAGESHGRARRQVKMKTQTNKKFQGAANIIIVKHKNKWCKIRKEHSEYRQDYQNGKKVHWRFSCYWLGFEGVEEEFLSFSGEAQWKKHPVFSFHLYFQEWGDRDVLPTAVNLVKAAIAERRDKISMDAPGENTVHISKRACLSINKWIVWFNWLFVWYK